MKLDLLLLGRLSLRNLTRHRRRNGMLLLAICVAVGGVIFMSSLIRGFQYDLADSAVANLTGHLKVLAPGYRDDPSILKAFSVADTWQPVDQGGEVAGWTARVRVPAVIMSERQTRGVELVGISPEDEHISFVGSMEILGEALKNSADRRVIIGVALAETLQTKIGRRIVLITQGADGLNRESGFRIAGLFDAEGSGLEKRFVFTGLERLQGLLDTSRVTEVSVRLSKLTSEGKVRQGLVDEFPGQEILDWQQLEPQAAAMFVFADSAIFIWFAVMMGALVFGLVNTLITAVMERIKELGMLRAIGMRRSAVVIQVVVESTIIMAAGVLVGVGLGFLLIYWVADGIDLSQWAAGVEMAGMRSLLVPRVNADDVLMISVLSLVMGILASLYPAWRAVKIKPLDAISR